MANKSIIHFNTGEEPKSAGSWCHHHHPMISLSLDKCEYGHCYLTSILCAMYIALRIIHDVLALCTSFLDPCWENATKILKGITEFYSLDYQYSSSFCSSPTGRCRNSCYDMASLNTDVVLHPNQSPRFFSQ